MAPSRCLRHLSRQAEPPAFLDILPPGRGLSGRDIGCGEGSNARELVRLRAKCIAIDVAPTFVLSVRDTESAERLGRTYLVTGATGMPFASGVRFATAFMSMIDIADLARGHVKAAPVLQPGGFLQFSILHPFRHSAVYGARRMAPSGLLRSMSTSTRSTEGLTRFGLKPFHRRSAKRPSRSPGSQVPPDAERMGHFD